MFAATESVVPLVGTELASAALNMPIAFLRRAEGFILSAILSPVPGQNLFVDDNGQWLGDYVPAFLRTYPFRIFEVPSVEDRVLCVDEAAEVVAEPDRGEPFFTQSGSLTPNTEAVFAFLKRFEADRRGTDAAVAALSAAGLLRNWDINVTADGEKHPISGVFCLDEAAMNALDSEAFLGLRRSLALPLAYAQLLSMGQIGIFSRLARLRSLLTETRVQQTPIENVTFAMPSDDTLHFD